MGDATAFVEMEDGVNEYGLAVGLTSVYPKCLGYGLNAGMLLRYGLEVCYADDEKPFVSAVNAFYLEGMKIYRVQGIDNWNAKERYETMQAAFHAFCRDGRKDAVPLAADILRGKYGFICQYDRKTGKDTVWSVIYDVGIKKIYRCEGNPARKRYTEDSRFTFE